MTTYCYIQYFSSETSICFTDTLIKGQAMTKYTATITNPNIRKIRYLCDHPDSQPGDVEPCAGTDTEEPSCGISIMDTDGEWIEMKNGSKKLYRMILKHATNNIYGRIR